MLSSSRINPRNDPLGALRNATIHISSYLDGIIKAREDVNLVELCDCELNENLKEMVIYKLLPSLASIFDCHFEGPYFLFSAPTTYWTMIDEVLKYAQEDKTGTLSEKNLVDMNH